MTPTRSFLPVFNKAYLKVVATMTMTMPMTMPMTMTMPMPVPVPMPMPMPTLTPPHHPTTIRVPVEVTPIQGDVLLRVTRLPHNTLQVLLAGWLICVLQGGGSSRLGGRVTGWLMSVGVAVGWGAVVLGGAVYGAMRGPGRMLASFGWACIAA